MEKRINGGIKFTTPYALCGDTNLPPPSPLELALNFTSTSEHDIRFMKIVSHFAMQPTLKCVMETPVNYSVLDSR